MWLEGLKSPRIDCQVRSLVRIPLLGNGMAINKNAPFPVFVASGCGGSGRSGGVAAAGGGGAPPAGPAGGVPLCPRGQPASAQLQREPGLQPSRGKQLQGHPERHTGAEAALHHVSDTAAVESGRSSGRGAPGQADGAKADAQDLCSYRPPDPARKP